MNTTLLTATSIFDCESQYDCVKIDYVVDEPGIPVRNKTEWIYTKTLGDWKKINFSTDDGVTVERFLDSMVVKNLEVWRKMCVLLLKKIGFDYHRYLYLTEILDPTFKSPRINYGCRWQREFADSFMNQDFMGVISTCTNKRRLEKLYTELVYIVNN